MSEPRAVTSKASERVNDLPRILQAMQAAVRDALLLHRRAGNPVAAWREGRVEWIQPGDLRIEGEEPF